MRLRYRGPQAGFVGTLVLASLGSMALFGIAAWRNGSPEYSYLVTNLLLAWLPLGFAFWLINVLKRKLWSSWEGLAATALWLLFLPNSFYMISDFVHLQEIARVDILFDAVMFSSFIFVGLVLGMASLYLVHLQIRKRVSPRSSALWLAGVLLMCSFAIYLGRDLRWNSWDVLINPSGLLFDVSERFMNPGAYPQMTLTVLSFFVLLGSIYAIAWKGIRLVRVDR